MLPYMGKYTFILRPCSLSGFYIPFASEKIKHISKEPPVAGCLDLPLSTIN